MIFVECPGEPILQENIWDRAVSDRKSRLKGAFGVCPPRLPLSGPTFSLSVTELVISTPWVFRLPSHPAYEVNV